MIIILLVGGGNDTWLHLLAAGGYIPPQKPIGSPWPRVDDFLWLCPSARGPAALVTDPRIWYGDYLYNAANFGTLGIGHWQVLRDSRLNAPSRTVVLMDRTHPASAWINVWTWAEVNPAIRVYMHSEGANFLWADGHVTWLPEPEIIMTMFNHTH